MRILYIDSKFGSPRASSHARVYHFAQRLLERGHEVTIIGRDSGRGDSIRIGTGVAACNILHQRSPGRSTVALPEFPPVHSVIGAEIEAAGPARDRPLRCESTTPNQPS